MSKQQSSKHISRWVKCFAVLYLCLMGVVAIHAANHRQHYAATSNSGVLICTSPKAYAYHSHYCKGLKQCKYSVKTTTRQQAEKKGYKPCKFCYP